MKYAILPPVAEAAHLAGQVRSFFGGPQPWTYPFLPSVADLSAAQAVVVAAPRMNSVYAVVFHVTFWHEVVLRRLRGEPVDEAAVRAGGWPEPSASIDEDAWRLLLRRVESLNEELATAVASLSDVALTEPYAAGRAARFELVSGFIAHTAYHACEVACIRQLQGLWDRP